MNTLIFLLYKKITYYTYKKNSVQHASHGVQKIYFFLYFCTLITVIKTKMTKSPYAKSKKTQY